MCLIAFAWQAHDDFPLIVAGNRDEFFERPTAPADWWPDGVRLAGRDLRAGGTWMGVARNGRFAALTNHRDPTAMRADAPSRGALVGDFLAAGCPPAAALEQIAGTAARYNGFNLLAAQWSATRADAMGMWVVSGPADATPLGIVPGVHALSNARLDTSWPKVDRAGDALRTVVKTVRSVDALVDDLFALLDDRTIADDRDLPRTGVPLAVERALSAAFIRMPGYGTRASTVLVVDRHGRATFVERRCEPDRPFVEQRFSFVAEPSSGDEADGRSRLSAVRVP